MRAHTDTCIVASCMFAAHDSIATLFYHVLSVHRNKSRIFSALFGFALLMFVETRTFVCIFDCAAKFKHLFFGLISFGFVAHTHTHCGELARCLFRFKIDSLSMLFSYCCLLLLLYAISIVHRIFDWAFRNTRAHLVSIFVSIDLINEWYDVNSHDFLIKRSSRFRCVTHIYATKNEIHWFRI